MNLALNEVQAMATKAARGSGYDWGIAEEAGFAARWLCAHGLDGCAGLAALLQGPLPANLTLAMPVRTKDGWSARSGSLCPLFMGTTISDFAGDIAETPQSLSAVAQPLLLMPFLANSAQQTGGCLSAVWQDLAFTTDGKTSCLSGSPAIAHDGSSTDVRVSLGGSIQRPLPQLPRASPDPADWRVLSEFAGRTYAPETEQSRNSGAGPGTDRD